MRKFGGLTFRIRPNRSAHCLQWERRAQRGRVRGAEGRAQASRALAGINCRDEFVVSAHGSNSQKQNPRRHCQPGVYAEGSMPSSRRTGKAMKYRSREWFGHRTLHACAGTRRRRCMQKEAGINRSWPVLSGWVYQRRHSGVRHRGCQYACGYWADSLGKFPTARH